MGKNFAVRRAESGFPAGSNIWLQFRLEMDRLLERLARTFEGLPVRAFAAGPAFTTQSKFHDGLLMVTVLEPGRAGNVRNVEEKAA
jgi:hypothetical protein